MGCWNGTCGLSQLPILAGDDIWAFLIGVRWGRYSDSGDQSGYCYPTDIGFPMSLPIYGKYNDYGGIDRIKENYNTKIIMDAYGENYKNIESFLNDCVERDKFFLFNQYIEKYGVGLFMVHAELMDDLKSAKVSYGKKVTVYNTVKKDAEYFFQDAPAILEELNKTESKLRSKGFFTGIETLERKCRKVEYTNWFAHRFSGMGSNCIVDSWEPYRDFIMGLLKDKKTLSDQTVKELIVDTANLEVVNSSMHSLRKGWIPQSGKGSQSEEFDFYWKLTTGMRRYINKIIDERKEWYDEE